VSLSLKGMLPCLGMQFSSLKEAGFMKSQLIKIILWIGSSAVYTSQEHRGHAVAYLVETLCYKPEGHGFDS
jgi:hypothetical protein